MIVLRNLSTLTGSLILGINFLSATTACESPVLLSRSKFSPEDYKNPQLLFDYAVSQLKVKYEEKSPDENIILSTKTNTECPIPIYKNITSPIVAHSFNMDSSSPTRITLSPTEITLIERGQYRYNQGLIKDEICHWLENHLTNNPTNKINLAYFAALGHNDDYLKTIP